MRKKIWAWIMTVMMVISMMPTSVFAGINDTTKQTDNGQKVAAEQTNADQIGNYFKVNVSKDKDNKNVGTLENSPTLKANKWADTQKTYEDNKVKVNKTIEATDEENVFDITLTVSTSEEIEKVESNADAAVVLVIDCSGSMDGDRLRTAKKAAQTFINGFVAKKADGTVDANVKRKIAIVRYSGSKNTPGYDGANTVVDWTDASKLKTNNNNQLCNAINNLSAGGATNTEAGLMLGRNLLEKHANNADTLKGITNKNIILLTDGAPTLGVTDSAESKYENALKTICPQNTNGYSIDSVGKGNETTCDTHKDAETIAKQLKTDGYGTYAIYVGDQNVDCETKGCTLNKSGADWLYYNCGFTTYSATDNNRDKLIDIFEKILELIEQKAQAWILTDPMGTNIEFVEFKSEKNPVNEFTQKDGTITWDLKNSARGNESTETGYTTYELKYRVKLDTLADGYSAGTYYATNGVTSVTYLITKTENGQTSYKFDTAYFNVPSVKGYDAGFSFKKVGSFGEALSGATFKLTHACGDSCKDTQVTNASWAKATSDSNGKVSFANIPSGHTYTLTETKAPGTNGQYTKSNETYTVTVAYGELTITDKDGKTVDASALQVVNESDTIDIEGTKNWNDNNNQDGKRPSEITVELYANGQKVTEADGETAVTAVANADNGWKWSFNNLPKYKGGEEITYTIKEVNVPAGYEASNNGVGNAANNYTITNTHEIEKTSVSVAKVWNDANDQDGKRPDEITVKLLADGVDTGKTKTLSPENWSASFTELDKYRDGEEINYTIEEVSVEGYTSDTKENDDGTGFVITNTHTPETTSIEGTKTWDDADNQDGKRPESITVKLMKGTGDDAVKVAEKTVKAGTDGNWTYSFTNLPKYENGNEITYTVVEATVPDGYEADVDGYDITNTHTPEKVNIEGTKTWDDNNNQDGKRPESITVKLLADGEAAVDKDGEAITTTVTADNNWSYSFNNLPKFKDGKAITYTVTEDAVDGYTTDVDGYNITNTHTPEKVNIEGTKTWDDNNNQDGLRPESITVKLLADDKAAVDKDGEAITATVTADKDGNWAYSFTNLPKFKDGKAIKYTVAEDVVTGYDATVEGYDITNTHTPEKVDIPVSKTWDDADNQDGVRPGSIKVTLYEGTNATDKTLTLNADNNWSGSFTGLDKYKDGSEIKYTVDEEAVKDYTSKVTGSIADGFTITNTHKPETTSISGTKTWDDDGDRDGKRPKSITVNLLADGKAAVDKDGEEITATVTADKDGNWTYSFNNLPKKANGEEIKYTVSETAVENYSTTYDEGNNIKNSYTPAKTSITVTKAWDDANNQDGIRPASITVKLYAKSSADPIGSLVLNEANNWQGTFTDLNVNSIVSGVSRPIEYYVVEEIPEGYEVAITGNSSTGYTITNTHTPEIISVDGTKSWNDNDNRDDKRPEKITVNLLADDEAAVDKDGKAITATVTADNNWSYSFKNLPKFKDGKAITYTVVEATVPDGYESTVDGYNITNTHTPETVDISGTKTWKDADNQDGKRPESIKVNLLADGEAAVDKDGKAITTTVKAGSDGNWTWSFDNLPKYKDGEVGQEIAYTVTEEAVKDYTSKVTGSIADGFTITNTHEVEKTSINVAKVWADDDNRDNIRPDEITVKLFANGSDTGKTVKLNKENKWEASFTDLDKNSGGKAIEYTVDESGLPEGYTSTVNGNATVGYTITNSHTPAFVSISGTKTWNDGDNQDGIRPEKITVRLLADGTEVNSQTVAGTDNTWSYTFSTDKDGENLPKYNKGKEIKYTVSEDSVDGYTPSVNGYNITNTHTPSVTSISGSKTWNDNGDQDGVRPESITVRLHADGEEIASRTVTAASGWSWSFTNLPVNKAGLEINYTITEDAVQDYTPAINGANITNTHTPDKTSVAVSKAWNDDNNRDGKRASIDVVLYANGTSTGKTITLTESNGWTGTFTGLDKNSNGEAINYTVKEANAPAGYSSSITGDADKGYTITNTYSPEKTSVSGSKTWNDDNNRDGKRPEKITVRLFANDKQIDQKVVGENDGWAWSFDDLYKYENGKEISYTITEDEVAEYATEIKGYDITNTYDDFETTEITVNKTWKGDSERERPDAVTVNLLADGKVVETVDLTAKDGWTHTFTDLPKYASGKAGTLVVYSVEEEAVEGYTPEIAGFEITNVKNPPADEDTPNPPADPGKPGKSDNGDKAAKTGDDMNIFALAGTAFAALIGAFAAFFRRKKKA